MAIELVYLGETPNDGTGDDLLTAFQKVNANFTQLAALVTESTTASNVGTGVSIFKNIENYDLKFKTINSGNNISITETTDEILIQAINLFKEINLSADLGSRILSNTEILNIKGGNNVSTEIQGNDLIVSANMTELSQDDSPELASSLNANSNSIVNVRLLTADNIESLIHGIDIREFAKYTIDFDLGPISKMNNIFDVLVTQTDIDFGTFDEPNTIEIDAGFF